MSFHTHANLCVRLVRVDLFAQSTQHTAHSTQHTAHSTQHTSTYNYPKSPQIQYENVKIFKKGQLCGMLTLKRPRQGLAWAITPPPTLLYTPHTPLATDGPRFIRLCANIGNSAQCDREEDHDGQEDADSG